MGKKPFSWDTAANEQGMYMGYTLKQYNNSRLFTEHRTPDQSIRGYSGYTHAGTETNTKRIGARKSAFESAFYSQTGMDAWKGNEWMKKALDSAWDKDEFSIRSAYTSKLNTYRQGNTGGEGGQDINEVGNSYGALDATVLQKLTHTYAAKAQEMYAQAQSDKEAERMLSERKARGGMGSRGSTLLTGGREGVLAKANTRKQTLIGAEG